MQARIVFLMLPFQWDGSEVYMYQNTYFQILSDVLVLLQTRAANFQIFRWSSSGLNTEPASDVFRLEESEHMS